MAAIALALAMRLQGPCLRQVVDEPLTAEEGADGWVEAAARQRLGQRDLRVGRMGVGCTMLVCCLLPSEP